MPGGMHSRCEVSPLYGLRSQRKAPEKRTNKTAMPQPYVFNRVLGVDVNYLADSDGTTSMFLNMVDIGTGFQIEAILREGHGTPTSSQCLDATMLHWISWAGYPKELTSDRGLNNRGVFCRELSSAGVYCGNIGLEPPLSTWESRKPWRYVENLVMGIRPLPMRLSVALGSLRIGIPLFRQKRRAS